MVAHGEVHKGGGGIRRREQMKGKNLTYKIKVLRECVYVSRMRCKGPFSGVEISKSVS